MYVTRLNNTMDDFAFPASGAKVSIMCILVTAVTGCMVFGRRDIKQKEFRMRWIFFVMSMGLCISAFGQNGGNAEIVGKWRNEQQKQTFQFNADGTFIMSADGDEVEQAMRNEQAAEGEVWTDHLSGTYTVTGRSVEMELASDGKTHKMRLTRVNANTLRMYFQNYIRVAEDR